MGKENSPSKSADRHSPLSFPPGKDKGLCGTGNILFQYSFHIYAKKLVLFRSTIYSRNKEE